MDRASTRPGSKPASPEEATAVTATAYDEWPQRPKADRPEHSPERLFTNQHCSVAHETQIATSCSGERTVRQLTRLRRPRLLAVPRNRSKPAHGCRSRAKRNGLR